MSYKVFMWRTENLSSYSLSRKYLLSPYYGPVSVQVFYMDEVVYMEERLLSSIYRWGNWITSHSLQAVGPTFEAKQSAPENVSTTMNSWFLFKENRWCGGNILGSDGGRINNSAGLTCREKCPCSEIYNEAERVVGLGSDSVLWHWASQLEMMKGDIF